MWQPRTRSRRKESSNEASRAGTRCSLTSTGSTQRWMSSRDANGNRSEPPKANSEDERAGPESPLRGGFLDLSRDVLGGGAGKRLDLHLARQCGRGNGRGNFEYPVAILRGQLVCIDAFGKQDAPLK